MDINSNYNCILDEIVVLFAKHDVSIIDVVAEIMSNPHDYPHLCKILLSDRIFQMRNSRKKMEITRDEQQILKYLKSSKNNCEMVCANDFELPVERFIEALNRLFHECCIRTPLCSYDSMDYTSHSQFKFQTVIEDCDTQVELLVTSKGENLV